MFFTVCWIASLCWLVWQGYQAWQSYLDVLADKDVLGFLKVPGLAMCVSYDHRWKVIFALIDTAGTFGTAMFVQSMVRGVSASGIGAVMGLVVSYAIRKSLSDYRQKVGSPRRG